MPQHMQPLNSQNSDGIYSDITTDTLCRIDKFEPLCNIRPVTTEKVSAILINATDSGSSVVPIGGGTGIHCGNALRASSYVALSTTGLNAIVEYSPNDLVVTAQAGVTLARLQLELAIRGQMLPIDVPYPEQATLGGIVARNAQGLLRHPFGTPRDILLGLRCVTPDGTPIKSGGKVVKNVAGYDLCKLFAGSWGTLGVITEVTFKVRPIPQCVKTIAFAAGSVRQACKVALHIHEAQLEPTFMVVVNTPYPTLYIGLQGHTETVDWQENAIAKLISDYKLERISDLFHDDDSLRLALCSPEARVVAKITCKPSELPSLVNHRLFSHAHLACSIQMGAITAAFDDTGLTPAFASSLAAILPTGAHLLWCRLPYEWKRDVETWNTLPAIVSLNRRMKAALDPRLIMCPGRFMGRI